jgi:hypothetical protein
MNELVTADRGVLVPWQRSEPRKLGTNYYVDPGWLEDAINSLIERSIQEKADLGRAARSWFDANDISFRSNLERLSQSLLPPSGLA